MFREVGNGLVNVWMDVSVDWWWLGGCVGRCLVVGWVCCMEVSVDGLM